MKMKLEKGMPISLNDQVAHPDLMWPTPNSSPNTISQTVEATLSLRERERKQGQLMEAVVDRMYPTPAARDHKDVGENTDYQKLADKSKLAGVVMVQEMENNMWLTPSATNISERSEEALEKREKMRNESGRKTVPPGSLAEQVKYGYPITDMRQEKMWPTPNASDNRDRGNLSDPAIQRRIALGKQVNLSMAVKDEPKKGTLNPEWVEWLMGYPPGWTDITDSNESPASQE
jgi:DNA (cytosine-5)-methyltransferase 1